MLDPTLEPKDVAVVSCVLVLTALGDCSRGGQVSVLAVHVVGATAGVIAQPDAKVLYLQRRLLMNLGIEEEKSDL